MIIRYSMLNDWQTCPKHFYDRHVLGKIETEKSASLEFGTALHLGLRTALEGEDGVAAFLMYWDSIKTSRLTYYGESWASLRESGEHFLGTFRSRHMKKFSDFKQEVQMEMPWALIKGHPDYLLQGTADLIGMYEGKLSVVDWKTSSRAYKKNKILLNPQMYIYAKLYQYNFGKLPEQVVYKVFNKKDGCINTITNQLTQEYLDAIFVCIENAARGMLRTIETKEVWHGSDCYCDTL